METITVNTFLPMRNKFVYSFSIKILALGFDELLESIFCLLLVMAEKAMASHSSTLAWKIPWAEEPGRLQPMGSLGVGHD